MSSESPEPDAGPVRTTSDRHGMRRAMPPPEPKRWGAFWPVLIATTAFLGWTAFQTTQLLAESTSLAATKAQQEPIVQNANKMRQSLDSIAAQTQRLADQGNANAKALVDELRKRGVTINATNAVAPGGSAAPSPTSR